MVDKIGSYLYLMAKLAGNILMEFVEVIIHFHINNHLSTIFAFLYMVSAFILKLKKKKIFCWLSLYKFIMLPNV